MGGPSVAGPRKTLRPVGSGGNGRDKSERERLGTRLLPEFILIQCAPTASSVNSTGRISAAHSLCADDISWRNFD